MAGFGSIDFYRKVLYHERESFRSNTKRKRTRGGEVRMGPDLNGMKLLLVEDNEVNIEIAKCLLEGEGILITPAENGQFAVDMFAASEAGDYDAVLMDVMMPVMDGLAAARAIRAMDRPDAAEIPIIAMTANNCEEDIQQAYEAGMNAYLSKPLNLAEILKVLSGFR